MALYLNITDNSQDVLLDQLLAEARAEIDHICARTFEAGAAATRYFDAAADVEGRTLHLDRDLWSITSIVNGDGTTLLATDYVTRPRNDPPYYAIDLKASSAQAWTYDEDSENAIAVTGVWAYSDTAPAIVSQVCRRLVELSYNQRAQGGYAKMKVEDLEVMFTDQEPAKAAILADLNGLRR
jgi:hypothetical protein